ncbi:mechanosensitive ion channel domain-containing protein [Isoptericola sp. AK164]|uniref:mechanosensitive ion channel family protein n=1 Tax=Isoptericola sp. AK164 TaxID=3024246 RepID=UPI00241894C5|nr:mechanosensitive ion channel domain-containing protein [Isoptericola sp. AK164]
MRDEPVIFSLPLPFDTDPAPEPSTSEGVLENAGDVAADAGNTFWEWFTGWPLQILVILLFGIVVLVALRRVISHVAERIALGGSKAVPAERKGWKAWFGRTPLVEDAMAVANPLASERRAQRARTVGSVLTSTANIVVGVMVVLSVLSAVGQPVGPLLASAGVAGIALGFGAQSLVRDFISGIFILIEDQYGVGDWVDLGSGAEGEVEEVQLRTTKVRALDGTLWWVRNGEILRAGNRTQRWSRALAEVHVPVDADVDVVRAALGRACDAVARSEEFGQEFLEPPAVRNGVDAVSDFSMSFTIMAQTRPGIQWNVSRALLRAAQDELRQVGAVRSERVEVPEQA